MTSSSFVFSVDAIRMLANAPSVVLTEPVETVYLYVAPCSGSMLEAHDRPSNFVILTFAGPVLLGMESFPANRSEDYEEVLLAHAHAVMNQPHSQGAKLVVDVESGTGLTAGDISRLMKQEFGARDAVRNHRGKPGRKMTYSVRGDAVEFTENLLKEGHLKVSSTFVSSTPRILEEFMAQMLRYTKQETATTPQGDTRITYSGKGPNKKNDDLADAFVFALLFQHRYHQEEEQAAAEEVVAQMTAFTI